MENTTSVLVIDDDIDIRERLKKMLERRECSVLTAENGVEALEVLKDHHVDVIFCDISMPQMDGLTFLKKVHELNLKAEVIMITGDSSLEKCAAAIALHACDYLIKPVGIEAIMENIAKAKKRIQEKNLMLKRALSMVHY